MDGSRKKLDNAFRRLLRTDSVSRDQELRKESLKDVIDSFNLHYNIVKEYWDRISKGDQKKLIIKFASDRFSLEKCISEVPFEFLVSIPLNIGDGVSITQRREWKSDQNLAVPGNSKLTISKSYPDIPLSLKSSNNSSDSESEYEESTEIVDVLNSEMDAVGAIKLINSTLKNYSGEFDELNSFLINISIIEEAIPSTFQTLATQCIRGKLQGAAASFVPANATTYSEITTALKNNIKPNTTKVIEAKLSATRFDNHNLTKFSEEVEKIANQLYQTFINEGIPISVANELTISRVVETCRKSAKNDLVKSVLASTTFDTPKAVLSKFVTEVADQNKDMQFLAFQRQRPNNNAQRGGSYPRYNYQYRGSNNFPQHRGSFQNRGGFHNRGGFQSRGGYQSRGGSNNRGSYNNDRTNQNVRVIREEESENETTARWPALEQ